jgi:hypothetical protein
MSDGNKINLSEALKRYNLLSEYNFYIPRKDEDESFSEEEMLDEQDVTAPEAEIALPEEPTTELPTEEVPTMDTTTEPTIPMATDTTTPTTGGEVEVDVTDIVKDTKETKEAVNSGNQKVDELLNKLNDLETKLSSMNDLVNKIEELENEIEKRNPTPEEKLEMRSFDSYPYNLKLTDYWADKEGAYNVMGNDNSNVVSISKTSEPEEKEYVLTQGDVEKDYNEGEISDSFYPED